MFRHREYCLRVNKIRFRKLDKQILKFLSLLPIHAISFLMIESIQFLK